MRFVWLLLSLFIAGCYEPPQSMPTRSPYTKSTARNTAKTNPHNERDGAPAGPPPTRFEKVKPVKESFSRYGNPESYAVKGHTYEVMRSASGYKTKGIASWYGTKFHSQRTSSGDEYDMYSMTAAHKTLPLPSYVRVRNLENGRVAIVKVNDRGPFHEGRVIDLSYAAATRLGVFPKGTAAVEIEALTMPGAHVAHYYVQAGAFNSQVLANLLRDKLSKVSPSPVFIEHYEGRYIVKVGPFAEKRMTDSLKMQLARMDIPGAFSVLQ